MKEQERIEEALKESEERYRAVMEQSVEAIYLFDPDSKRILESNAAFQGLMGYTADELLGMTVYDFNAHRKDDVDANVQRSLGKRGRFVGERNYHRKDGSTITVEISTSVIPYDGKMALCTVSRDVTERKRFEEALRESEGRFRQLFERSTDALLVHDEYGRMVDCNAEACRSLGYTREELLKLSVKDFAVDVLSEEEKRAKRGDTPWARAMTVEPGTVVGLHENWHRRKDGTTFPVEVGIGAIDYGGRRLIFASARDLTERKRTEEALIESEERYRAVMEQSVEAIYLYDAQTKQVLESNEAFRRMMGYTEEELIGRQIYDFIDHDRENIDANVGRSLREKRRHIGERRYRRKDGSVIVVDTSASVISYKGKMALCAVSRDVTERKRFEEALKESEERFRSLTQNASDVVAVIRADGITRYVSPSIEHVLGYKPEERMDASSFELIHPDDVARVRRLFAELVASPGGSVTVEFRLRHKDGSWRHVEAIGKNLIDDASIAGVIVTYHDVTERKRAGEVLAEERNLLRTLIDNMPDFIFVKDKESRFVINNPEHARALGAPAEELVGKTDFDVFPRELAERYYSDEQEIIRSGRALVDTEEPVVDQEGNHGWLSTTKVPLRDGDGEISGLVGISRDITDRKALEEQLRHRAFHDPLTELPNRALFLDRLGHAMSRSGRLREPVAVLFVDLDDFKRINDSLGHELGDRLLVEVASRLSSCVRPGDTVARLFGDEFAVLLEAPAGMEDARRIAERIQERLRVPFAFDEREVFAGCSVGIVLNDPDRARQPKEVLRHADLAMYVAKSRGKNRYETFNPSMDTRVWERMELENDLRRAIEREEFEVHYQPIVEPGSARVAGLEALARWRHPERGLLAAREFIQVAEYTGLIRPIGQLVFEEACRQAREWRERYPNREILMCVNFSASQFVYQADLIPKVLSDTGLDPEGLRLEITERAVMDDAEFSIGKLQRLKDLGVGFAIDDYGTGYSCLYYLKRMPVDSLKIDGSFVAGLGKDPGDDAIVSGTIDLAHALGLKVVAEGVETAEQHRKLKELNCDLAQGYYFSEPLPVDAASDLLKENNR